MGMGKDWYAGRPGKMLTRAVCDAIRNAGDITSQRTLARATGLSHGHLALVYAGQRRLTPETAEAVAKVLEAWGASCTASAKAIRAAAAKAAALKVEASAELAQRGKK